MRSVHWDTLCRDVEGPVEHRLHLGILRLVCGGVRPQGLPERWAAVGEVDDERLAAALVAVAAKEGRAPGEVVERDCLRGRGYGWERVRLFE